MLRLKSSDSVRTISLDRNELLKALGAIAARIHRERPEVVSVRIFGSIARGDQSGTSDADILIIVRSGTEGDPLLRMRSFYGYFRLPVPIDLLVYSEDQISRLLKEKDPHFTRLWTESRPLLP